MLLFRHQARYSALRRSPGHLFAIHKTAVRLPDDRIRLHSRKPTFRGIEIVIFRGPAWGGQAPALGFGVARLDEAPHARTHALILGVRVDKDRAENVVALGKDPDNNAA